MFNGLVIVATESDAVYALSESSGQVMWQVNLGTPVPAGELPCGDISPTVGVTSTPVIDPAVGHLFVSADTWDGHNAQHKLFALNVSDGSIVSGFPVATDPPGTDHTALLQRAALALAGGHVIIGFGGNDGDCSTHHGWLVSVPESGGAVQSTFEVEPQSGASGGAVWGAGDGPTVDVSGNVWAETGNGFGSGYGYQESVLKLDANLNLLDHWAPANWQYLDDNDIDLGSADPLPLPHGLWFIIGKYGTGYLLSGSDLGGTGADPVYSAPICAGSFGGGVYANGIIYVTCSDGLHAVSLNQSAQTFSAVPDWQVHSAANGPPVVTGGLVWVAGWGSQQLFGLNAKTGQVVVDQTGLPTMMHFTSPSASDGKLFLATGQTVKAYSVADPAGPPPSAAPPSTTPPPIPTCGCHGNRCQMRLALRAPRGTRVTRAAVYFNKKRISLKRGRRLKAVWFPSPAHRRSFTVRLVETTSAHRRIVRFVSYRNCRRVLGRR